ncbi:MAG: hypothetical protein Q9157_000664 [Trypethelium eluteriae]
MENRNQLFRALKPPCVGLSQAVLSFAANKSSGKDVTQALEKLLRTLESLSAQKNSFDEKLADYVFFPLSHVLRESQKLPVRALELCLQCVAILFETGWRHNIAINLSGQLLILLTFLAGKGSPVKKLEGISEELRVAAFHCLSLLFASLKQTSGGEESLVGTANVPQLGQTVTAMLEGIVEGTSSEVQLFALSALRSLLSCLSDHDVLTNFFPGIVSSLAKVLIPSAKSRRNYKLLEGALMLLASLLNSILGDDKTKELPPGTAKDEEDHARPGPVRTKIWLRATSGQVKQVLASIMKIWDHDRKEVKHAIAELCAVVLQDCRVSLSESAGMTLETLVMLSDEDSQMSRSSNILKHLLDVNPDLCEILRDSLRSWTISLPRVMESNDDVAKQRLVHRISLAYQLLMERNTDLTNIDMVITANLRDSVTLATKDSSVLIKNNRNEQTISTLDMVITGDRHIATKFNDVLEGRRGQRDTMIEIKALVDRLSASSSAESLMQDLLLSCGKSRGELRAADMWLTVQFLKGVLQQTSSIDQYLDIGTEGIQRPEVMLDQLYTISLDVLTSADMDEEGDWRVQALALEVLTLQAQQQKERFREELVDALYPVLHLIGSQVDPLRQHAMTCLNLLATFSGYKNASELIVSNVDYLTNAVAFKLGGSEISPQAPMVLLMMVRLSGPSLIPYLDDIIGSIFVALEQYHGYPRLVELLFAVLRVVVEESVKTPQLVIESQSNESEATAQFQRANIIDIIEDIKKLKNRYEENKDIEEDIQGDFPKRPWKDPSGRPDGPKNLLDGTSITTDTEDDGEPPTDEPEEPGPPAPKTYNLLLSISQLTQHYLPSSSSQFRASLLSLLDTAIPVIATHENSFLPLINTLWPILMSRLSDEEAYVVVSTLDTIGLFCKYAGQFMKGRIEDLWPSVVDLYVEKFLREVGEAAIGEHYKATQGTDHPKDLVMRDLSLERTSTVAYIDAPARRIWKGLINVLVLILEYVPVNEEIFDDILHILGPLLERREDIRQVLERRNPDALWLAIARHNGWAARNEPVNHGKHHTVSDPYSQLPDRLEIYRHAEWRFCGCRILVEPRANVPQR